MNKKYQIIYADPPWSYRQEQINFQSYDKGKKYKNDVTEHYQTMTNEDIRQLDVKSLTDENCLLFLWVTSPNLDVCITTGEACGFEYKPLAFVWVNVGSNY